MAAAAVVTPPVRAPAATAEHRSGRATGETLLDRYDRLVIATGARSAVSPIVGTGLPHVFTLRNIQDMRSMMAFLKTQKPAETVIVGTGFIGMEMAENLAALGMSITCPAGKHNTRRSRPGGMGRRRNDYR